MRRVKVLVVDDSAVVRQKLASIFSSDPEIEVLATAADPYIASHKIAHEVPDVITLDIEMPRMDGLTFLRKIMSQHPIPTVIVSSLTAKGSENAILAMEYGAVSVIKKPSFVDIDDETTRLAIEVVKGAAKARIKRRGLVNAPNPIIKKPTTETSFQTTNKVIAIGASTGGTEAILEFLKATPIDSNGIIIVQHMPEMFTRSFAERLNSICEITVKEATHGDSVIKGRALIAPGNKHMELRRTGARYYVELNDAPPVNRHRPSVDILFKSVAKYGGKNAIGIIMTGMGADGAAGMLDMRNAGAYTIAQDENSCVVFGMPKEAIKLGGACKTLSLMDMPAHVYRAGTGK